jgi:hypothetical protein
MELNKMTDDVNKLKQELARYKTLNHNLQDALSTRNEEEYDTKNANFVQLYKNHLKDLRRLTQDDKNALTILLLMVEKMNNQNAIVISQANMMKITKKSRSSVSNAIKALKKHKYVQIVKIGTSNAYVVNAAVFWQDDKDKKGHSAIFNATVVASLDEQEDQYIENWRGIKLKALPILKDELISEAPDQKTTTKKLTKS